MVAAQLRKFTKLTQADAAGMLNVSPKTQWSAEQVIDRGAPEVVAAVDRGEVAVSIAQRATR